MKTIKYLFLAFAAAFVLAGCSDDPTYTPGESDVENGYGVYFPSQENAGEKELDPADPTTLQLTAMRTNDTGAITVPVEITSNEEGVFTATEITFSEGATETNFVVSFPDAEIGKTYTCNIRITDKQYASIYGEKPAGVDFSITRVKWNQVVGKGGETKGKWRDDILSSSYGVPNQFAETDVEIFEREDKKNFFRIMSVYSESYLDKIMVQYTYDRVDVINYIDATDENKVYLPEQSTGATIIPDHGMVNFASFVPENNFANNKDYGTFKDGVITFPKNGIGIQRSATPADWYYGNQSGMQRIMMPGVKDYDYSLALTKSEPVDGKVNIDARLGADVTKVKYVFFEGSFSPTQAAAKSGDMAAGVIEDKDQEEITATGTIVAEMEKTGLYTIVANTYNAANEFKGYQYLPFGYIAAGEEKPVILSTGLIVSNKYASQGFTSENSVEFWANGEGVESGNYSIIETTKLAGLTAAELAAQAKKGKAFTADAIKAINGNGFSVVVGSLLGGTEYTALVWAFNGYVGNVITAAATTEGVRDPFKQIYTAADLYPMQKTDLFKTWDVWAIEGRTDPNRRNLGQYTFSENTTNDTAGVDAINLKGITLGAIADDTVVWEFYNGIVYTLKSTQLGTVTVGGTVYYVANAYLEVATGNGTTGDNAMVGGMTENGHIAFITNNKNGNLNGMWLRGFSDPDYTKYVADLLIYSEVLLTPPAASSTAPTGTSFQNLQSLSKELHAEPTNYVELRGRERAHALIDELNAESRIVNRATNVMRTEMPELGAVKAKVTFTKGIAKTPMTGSLLSIGIRADLEVK